MGETGGRKGEVDGNIYPRQAELTKNSCSEKWDIAIFFYD